MILALCLGGVAQAYVIQPRLATLHKARFERTIHREAAGQAFNLWHSGSTLVNLLMVGGLGVYCWRLGSLPSATRFVSTSKFRS